MTNLGTTIISLRWDESWVLIDYDIDMYPV